MTPLCFNTNSPERVTLLWASAEGVVCVAWSPTCNPEVAEGPRLPAWQGRMAPKMTQCVARRPERPARSPSSSPRQARPGPSEPASLPHVFCFLGRREAHSIQSQDTGQVGPTAATGQGKGQTSQEMEGPQPTADGVPGLREAQKVLQAITVTERRGKRTWDHSGLVPNETFRYQVKVPALSKAQTKVLPLPRPPDTHKRHRQQQQRQQQAQNPLPGGCRQLPSCRASPWCQRQRPEPSDHLEGSCSQQKVYTFPFPCVGKGWASHPERNPSSVQDK